VKRRLLILCASIFATPGCEGEGVRPLVPEFTLADAAAPVWDAGSPTPFPDAGEATCDHAGEALPELTLGARGTQQDLPLVAVQPGGTLEGDCVLGHATHLGRYRFSLATPTRVWARVQEGPDSRPALGQMRLRRACDPRDVVCVDAEVSWVDTVLAPGDWTIEVSAAQQAPTPPFLRVQVPRQDHCTESAFGEAGFGEVTDGEVRDGEPESPLHCGAGGGDVRPERFHVTLDAPARAIAEVVAATFDPILEVSANACPEPHQVLGCEDDEEPGVRRLPRLTGLELPAGRTALQVSAYGHETGHFTLVVRPELDIMPGACDEPWIPSLPVEEGRGSVVVPVYPGQQIFQPQCFVDSDPVAALFEVTVSRPMTLTVTRGAIRLAVSDTCTGEGRCVSREGVSPAMLRLARGKHIVGFSPDAVIGDDSVSMEYVLEARPPECRDGVDNDGDGRRDLGDPGCEDASDDDESDPLPAAACDDGRDNDGDARVDLADPGCAGPADDDEYEAPPAACANGLDDDGDGRIDHPADSGCRSPDGASEVDPCDPSMIVGQRGGQIFLPRGRGAAAGAGWERHVLAVDLDRRSAVSVDLALPDGLQGDAHIEFEPACDADLLAPPPMPFGGSRFFLDRAAGRHSLVVFLRQGIDVNVVIRTFSLARGCSDALDNDADGLLDAADPGCTYDLDDDEADDLPSAADACPEAPRVGAEGGSVEVLADPTVAGPFCGVNASGLGRLRILLDRASRVRVRSVDDEGRPRAAALAVQAGCLPENDLQACPTVEVGEATFERLDAGLWTVLVSVPDAPLDPTVWFEVEVQALEEAPAETPACGVSVVTLPLPLDGLPRRISVPAVGALDGSRCGAARGGEVVLAAVLDAPARLVVRAGGGADTIVSARRRCDVPETELGCNDDGGQDLGSRLVLDRVEPGPIHVVIDQVGAAETVDVQVEVTPL
jgi:hypothetical protein